MYTFKEGKNKYKNSRAHIESNSRAYRRHTAVSPAYCSNNNNYTVVYFVVVFFFTSFMPQYYLKIENKWKGKVNEKMLI